MLVWFNYSKSWIHEEAAEAYLKNPQSLLMIDMYPVLMLQPF